MDDWCRVLGIDPEPLEQPLKFQVVEEFRRSGVLRWLAQQMQEEIKGLENNIMAVDMSKPEAAFELTRWQAKRSVLERWLDAFVQIATEEEET